MELKIFYCWQQDSPVTTNRMLIADALAMAIQEVNRRISVTLKLDQAGEESRGLVSIPDEICAKLEACSVFVMDLTLVARVLQGSKLQPNGNVLFEAGYVLAMMRRLNMNPPPVVAVMNLVNGSERDLPFDFGWRPAITYRLAADASPSDCRTAKAALSSRLADALLAIIEGGLLFAGLSREAWEVGAFLDRDHTGGLARHQYYKTDEILRGSGLTPEEVEQGTAELRARGYLEELQTAGGKRGWPVRPTLSLFLLFDPICQPWNPREDARRILREFGTDAGTQLTAPRLKVKLGWDLRRLEPAMAQLISHTLAENAGEVNPPFKFPRIVLTERADLFMRGRFDPDALRTRGS